MRTIRDAVGPRSAREQEVEHGDQDGHQGAECGERHLHLHLQRRHLGGEDVQLLVVFGELFGVLPLDFPNLQECRLNLCRCDLRNHELRPLIRSIGDLRIAPGRHQTDCIGDCWDPGCRREIVPPDRPAPPWGLASVGWRSS